MKDNCSKCDSNMIKQCEYYFLGKLPPCAQYYRELLNQHLILVKSSVDATTKQISAIADEIEHGITGPVMSPELIRNGINRLRQLPKLLLT